MWIQIRDPEELAQLLRQAADAHHIYETSLGHSDPDWPMWYARYIFDHGKYKPTESP